MPGVTRSTTRRLWRYAIEQRAAKLVAEGHIRWKRDRGFWKIWHPHGSEPRYNLAYRGDGRRRIFYGVTRDGMGEAWREVIPHTRRPLLEAGRSGSRRPVTPCECPRNGCGDRRPGRGRGPDKYLSVGHAGRRPRVDRSLGQQDDCLCPSQRRSALNQAAPTHSRGGSALVKMDRTNV